MATLTNMNRFQRSPGLGERSRIRVSPVTRSSPKIQRTVSLDYLSGQWPRDINRLASDKATQTPSEWMDEAERQKKEAYHKRSSSVGSNGQQQHMKEMKDIRQKLRNSKESKGNLGSQRQSPLHGNHGLSAHAPHTVSRAITIPGNIPKAPPRIRFPNSVEGLNQEIANLVLKPETGQQDEDRVWGPTPDGHRAPVAELINSMTQTPSGNELLSGSSNGPGRSHSISPGATLPFMLENAELDYRTTSTIKEGDASWSGVTLYGRSPKFVPISREPPDGCDSEHIKVIQEEVRRPANEEIIYGTMIKPNGVELRPSSSSAFCSVSKHYMYKDNVTAIDTM